MPSNALLATAASSAAVARRKNAHAGSEAEKSRVLNAITRLDETLAAHRSQPANGTLDLEFRAALAEASLALAAMPRPRAADRPVAETRRILKEVALLGALDFPIGSADLALARERALQGWGGLLAAMLLVPAWRWPDAPALAEVPDWLWGDYVAWLFSAPAIFSAPGDSDLYAAHVRTRLEQLARLVERNPGSATVRAAADSYLAGGAHCAPLRFATGSLVRQAELRGRILSRMLQPGARPAFEPPAIPRSGRPLRVGFLNRHFEPSLETAATLACAMNLAPSAFDVSFFSLRAEEAPLPPGWPQGLKAPLVLPAPIERQIALLRSIGLDVLVFGGDLGIDFDGETRLALHRLAPLQVANRRSGFTSGLPEIDLGIAGDREVDAGASAAWTERLGLLRGPARSFHALAGEGDPEAPLTRQMLSLPAEAPLFAALVTASGVAPETLEAWAALLGRAPGARLMVGLVEEGRPIPAASHFCAVLQRILRSRGIGSERVSIFPVSLASPEKIRALLRLADVYLDSLSGHESDWMAQALALGVPAVALRRPRGAGLGTGALLLDSLGLGDWAAGDAAGYADRAVRLAEEAETRAALARDLKGALEHGAGFLDPLGAADAFGALLEAAFDERAAVGRPAFAAERTPVRCFCAASVPETVEAGQAALARDEIESAGFEAGLALRADPLDPAARLLRGRVLLADKDAARAIDYFSAALPRLKAQPEIWFPLATALQRTRRMAEAVQALETGLRLDPNRVDGWLMLVDLAERVEAREIAGEAWEVLKQIAPDDPRVAAHG